MYKKKIGNGMQIMALLLFTIMALACASQSSLVDGVQDINRSKEGAKIETPIDSLTVSSDLALN